MRLISFSALLAVMAALLSLTGCGRAEKADTDASGVSKVDAEQPEGADTSTEKGPFEELGARVDKGAKKLDVVIEKGAAELGEALERAGRELQEKSAEAERRRQEQPQSDGQSPNQSTESTVPTQ